MHKAIEGWNTLGLSPRAASPKTDQKAINSVNALAYM